MCSSPCDIWDLHFDCLVVRCLKLLKPSIDVGSLGWCLAGLGPVINAFLFSSLICRRKSTLEIGQDFVDCVTIVGVLDVVWVDCSLDLDPDFGKCFLLLVIGPPLVQVVLIELA